MIVEWRSTRVIVTADGRVFGEPGQKDEGM